MPFQYSLAERINLAERDGLKPTRSLKAKREPANAAEKVEDAELSHAASGVESGA
jgi:hypothetical protein